MLVLVWSASVSEGTAGYLCQVKPEGFLVEGVILVGLGCQVYHLATAGLEFPAALRVCWAQNARLLVAE